MEELRRVGRLLISDADFNGLLLETLNWVSEYIENDEALRFHVLVFYAPPEGGGYNLMVLDSPGWSEEVLPQMSAMAAERDEPLAAVFLLSSGTLTPTAVFPETASSAAPEAVPAVIVFGVTLDLRQNRTIVMIQEEDGRRRLGEVTSFPFIDDGMDAVQNDMLLQFLKVYAEELFNRRGLDLPGD